MSRRFSAAQRLATLKSARLIAAFAVILASCAAHAAQDVCSTEIQDRYGAPLRVFRSEKGYSKPVALDAVSPWLVLSTLAAEDKRFFEHPGIDLRAAARALWQDTKAGGKVSGASTLTQQLVRAMDPHPRNIWGKLREMLGALRLERKSSKREILQDYFNTVSYGAGTAGVEAASEAYFGTPAGDLSPAQAALLSGIPKSPPKYDPQKYPQNAITRQRLILRRMMDLGYINDDIYKRALAERTVIKDEPHPFAAPHFAQYALRHAPTGACTVRTTIDPQIQQSLQKLLRAHVAELRKHNVTNAALVAMDNRSGEILAWVGSADFSDSEHAGQVDGVTALRQPGSALKPFIYGLAFSRGWKTTDMLDDSPAYFPGGFAPKNYDETFHGPVSLREALACSFNVPAVRLTEKLGPDRVLGTLKEFGFSALRASSDKYGLGISLGDGEVTLMELAAAYSALSRGGYWREPKFLLDAHPGAPRRAMDPRSAYLVTDVLSDNGARARAFTLDSPFHLPFPFAAKTGTSKDYHDNWAIGYTPEWTIAVWAGNFDARPMKKVSGITGAGPILADAAAYMYSLRPSGDFPEPAGIKHIEVCPESGALPGPECPETKMEVFDARWLPGRICSLHAPGAAKATVARRVRPAVAFPVEGDVFKINPTAPPESQALLLSARDLPSGVTAQWRVDATAVPAAAGGVWWRLAPGIHRVRFTYDSNGKTVQSSPVRFTVLE
jgi:penicillin-binding protein 1C